MNRALALCLALALGPSGCGNKKKQSESGGGSADLPATIELGRVPSSARVVIGADVEKLSESRLVRLAIGQMYRRDPGLEERIEQLKADCEVEPTSDFEHLVIAMGAEPDQVVLVAAGDFEEARLARCLNKSVAAGGGSLTSKKAGGHTLYEVDSGERQVWLAVGANGVLAVSPSEAWLVETLGPGAKIESSAAMKDVLGRVDGDAAIWGAARVPPELGAGLVEATHGEVDQPPVAAFGALDLTDGVKARLSFVMADPEDAEAAASKAVLELALASVAAQKLGLGRLVGKVQAAVDGPILALSLDLAIEELNELLTELPGQPGKGLDTGGAPPQNPPGSESPN